MVIKKETEFVCFVYFIVDCLKIEMNKFVFSDLRNIWKVWFLFGYMKDIREKMAY